MMVDRPDRLAVVAAIRPDASLRHAGIKTSPKALAEDASWPWRTTSAWLYGRWRTVEFKTIVACWPHVYGEQALRIVVVRCHEGTVPLRVFYSTETSASVRAVLEHYAGTRWPIECTFRDLKQHLGLAQAGVRLETSVLRLAPWVGLVYSVLILWSVTADLQVGTAVIPVRRWYRQKRTLSFQDVLRSARKMLETGDLHALDRAAHNAAREPLPSASPRLKRAA
jgi:hypothetical protein